MIAQTSPVASALNSLAFLGNARSSLGLIAPGYILVISTHKICLTKSYILPILTLDAGRRQLMPDQRRFEPPAGHAGDARAGRGGSAAAHDGPVQRALSDAGLDP